MAHLLTGIRLALALPLAVAYARPGFLHAGLVAVLLTVAIFTDLLDGAVARRRATATPGGQLFDHVTDCLFVAACLTGAALSGRVTAALPVLVVLAFAQYVVDSYWLHREKRLRMSAVGRWNGIGYFVPLVILAAAPLEVIPHQAAVLTPLAGITAWVLVGSTVVSIVDRATAARRGSG